MDYDSLLQLVKNRRSIRRFKADAVPGEMIEKIIEVARWAPSGFNMQPWEFVVVQKPELREKVVEIVGEYWPSGKTHGNHQGVMAGSLMATQWCG